MTADLLHIMFNVMVEYKVEHLDQTFHALSHPIRRGVIAHLAERQATIGEIASWYKISLNGASKHVKVLEQAGLLTRTVEGRTHYISLQTARLREAGEWITYHRRFWERRLDALENLLENATMTVRYWRGVRSGSDLVIDCAERVGDRVFAAWTTAEQVQRWMCPEDGSVAVAELDVRVGGSFRIDCCPMVCALPSLCC